MNAYDVTIVIPHYGPAEQTRSLVRSLRQQFHGPIVVVDDAYPEPYETGDSEILVRRDSNGGFGSSVNSGLAGVSTTHAVVLNSDLTFGEGFIGALQRAVERWPEAVLSPQILGHDGCPQWVGRHFPRVVHQFVEWLTPLARFRHLRLLHEAVGHDTRVSTGDVPVDWVMGAAMVLPMEAVRAVGGFDERFFMNCEEVDLQRRLAARGVHAVVICDAIAVHEGGGSSESGRRRQWLVDARFVYAGKWGGARPLRVALTVASHINFLVNMIRQAARHKVDAIGTLNLERALLSHGVEAAMQGRANR
ncbi:MULTISPECIES: glycosyltransferase family 2 protein [Arthrobacter]|uniref:Glycosyltransferase family 2 protein n=2 Tax=Arthrobacter TaxID=1663 RepID=A0ABU9KLE2_9MICC|nr:glycosyltransferase family 2 protein [Arthrobacter sp. YJM1]MDP5227724.1 glycosyltransferase family 2 protein [Arthrobacter sp. YJM1]